MRVCHVVPSLEERHGGPSKSVRSLANALARAGDQVDLLATVDPGDPAPSAAADAATLRTFPTGHPRWLTRSPLLREHLRRTPADCVHQHSLWLLTLRYATEAARWHGASLVISPRGMMTSWAWNHRRWRKWISQTFVHPGAFREAAGWHATSAEEADDIRRLGFRQPICVSPNGVVLPEEGALSAARGRWLELCPAAADRPVAVFYSRLHRKKRVRELIDLWLSRKRGDWLLLVTGLAEEYEATSLAAEVDARHAGDRVVVHDSAGLPPPYAIGSLFLLPSHSENFGLVIAEALAAGVPALVTDTTPWRGLADAGAGWCVPWEQYGGALDAALAVSPAELAAMGRSGREWMQRSYSWDRAAALLRQFYRELAHARR